MNLTIPCELYSKAAILKAAYSFTDRAYIFINKVNDNYVIDFDLKDGQEAIFEKEFKNELLAQAVRVAILEQTRELRNIIATRALASTVINSLEVDKDELPNYDIDSILKDWYDNETATL